MAGNPCIRSIKVFSKDPACRFLNFDIYRRVYPAPRRWSGVPSFSLYEQTCEVRCFERERIAFGGNRLLQRRSPLLFGNLPVCAESVQDFFSCFSGIFWESVWTQAFGSVGNCSEERCFTEAHRILRFVEVKPRCRRCADNIATVGEHIEVKG